MSHRILGFASVCLFAASLAAQSQPTQNTGSCCEGAGASEVRVVKTKSLPATVRVSEGGGQIILTTSKEGATCPAECCEGTGAVSLKAKECTIVCPAEGSPNGGLATIQLSGDVLATTCALACQDACEKACAVACVKACEEACSDAKSDGNVEVAGLAFGTEPMVIRTAKDGMDLRITLSDDQRNALALGGLAGMSKVISLDDVTSLEKHLIVHRSSPEAGKRATTTDSTEECEECCPCATCKCDCHQQKHAEAKKAHGHAFSMLGGDAPPGSMKVYHDATPHALTWSSAPGHPKHLATLGELSDVMVFGQHDGEDEDEDEDVKIEIFINGKKVWSRGAEGRATLTPHHPKHDAQVKETRDFRITKPPAAPKATVAPKAPKAPKPPKAPKVAPPPPAKDVHPLRLARRVEALREEARGNAESTRKVTELVREAAEADREQANALRVHAAEVREHASKAREEVLQSRVHVAANPFLRLAPASAREADSTPKTDDIQALRRELERVERQIAELERQLKSVDQGNDR